MLNNKSILNLGISSLFLLGLYSSKPLSCLSGSMISKPDIKPSSSENQKLIDYLQATRKVITTPRIATAMKQVDRRDFVRGVDATRSYADSPLTISYNVTISAPHMHAYALVGSIISRNT